MKLRRIFFKYCLRYFTAFLILLACCFFLARRADKSVEAYVVKTNQLRLREGVSQIRESLSKMDLIARMIQGDIFFNSLSRQKGKLSPSQSLDLRYANQQLNNIGFLYTFSPYGFSMFRDNDLFISTSQCSFDFPNYYGRFFQVEDGRALTWEEFKRKLMENADANQPFWKVDAISYYAGGKKETVRNAILCIVKGNSAVKPDPSYVMVFLLRPEDIVQKILTQECQEGGILQVTGRKGNQLLSYGKDAFLLTEVPKDGWVGKGKSSYRVLAYAMGDTGWKVAIGLPASLLGEQSKDVEALLGVYLWIGLFFVVLLTFYFSYRQYSHVRRLFCMVVEEPRHPGKGQDEYDLLCRILGDMTEDKKTYQRQMEALYQQNQAILLENLIVGGWHTDEERKVLATCLPRPLEFFCVALVKISPSLAEARQVALLCVIQHLKSQYRHGFANVHTGASDELFLMYMEPDDPSDVGRIKELFEGIVLRITEDMGLTFHVGISGVGAGISNVNTCYNQALQVIQAFGREDENMVQAYHIHLNQAVENVVGPEFLNKLYNLLMCGERELLEGQFNRLANGYEKMPLHYEAQKQQMFYSVWNMIHSAYLHLPTGAWGGEGMPKYKESDSVPAMWACLKEAAFRFCDCLEENKKSRNVELKRGILSFLEHHYASPGLTAAWVSNEMGISEKYLSQFIKEQTGETFAEHVEKLRIEAAIHYLLTTDLSNERIAQEVGFSAVNTFYRVFHKRMGVSPGTYRNEHF